jgi:hypothetical protein
MRDGPVAAVVSRLLTDAERHAAHGRAREALLLLAWAAQVAPRGWVTEVLLSYHRTRAHVTPSDDSGAPGAGTPPDRSGDLSQERPGATDTLGFPVPRFPAHPPELDREAFIPHRRRPAPGPLPTPREHPGRAARSFPPRVPTAARLALLALIAVLAPGLRGVLSAVWGRESVAAQAEQAIAAGEAGRALELAERVGEPLPRLLLLRGRARLALGDTLGAVAELRVAAAHRGATAAEAAEAARLLASWPGHANAAADAYVAAFAAGLPRASWPEVIEALRRARRGWEADRVANFLQSPEHLTRYTAP